MPGKGREVKSDGAHGFAAGNRKRLVGSRPRGEDLAFEAEAGIGRGGGEEDAVVRLRNRAQADRLGVVVGS